MTAVLVPSDLPSPGVLGATAAERIALGTQPPTDREFLFLDVVQARLHEQGAVIVVYPTWQAEPWARLIRFARTSLSTDRIAGIPLSLAPLALALVADKLAFLAPYVPPGLLTSVAHRLPDELIAGAWMRSVAKLEHVPTPLKAHLASYLPGAFLAIAAPRPGVHRLAGHHPVVDLGRRPAEPILLLVADSGGDAQWVQRHLAPELRPAGMARAQPQPLGPAFWGTQKYLEFVAFSGHPEALSTIARTMVCHPCPWCDEPTGLQTCAFCGMTQQHAAAEGPAPVVPQPRAPRPVAAEPTAAQSPQPHPQPVPPHRGDVLVVPAPATDGSAAADMRGAALSSAPAGAGPTPNGAGKPPPPHREPARQPDATAADEGGWFTRPVRRTNDRGTIE